MEFSVYLNLDVICVQLRGILIYLSNYTQSDSLLVETKMFGVMVTQWRCWR